MDALFLSLLDRSLSASWVVLAVIALRFVLKKSPRWLHCALWALVAVRLVCPFSFESSISLMPDVDFPSQEILDAAYVEPGEILALQSYPTRALDTESPASEQQAPAAAQNREGSAVAVIAAEGAEDTSHWLEIISTLWSVGVAWMLLYAAISYLRLKKRVSVSIELGNGVYLCDYVDSPFILGIIKPKIYLPSDMDPRDAGHVLAHERAHLKRKDHWWKPAGFALLSVYWFHPLMWLAYYLLCRDIELACDERVVKDMAHSDKKAYSEALLKCSVPRHMIVACPLAFGEVGVKERVKSVLHYQKPAFRVVVIAVVVCLIAAVCFLTDPVQAEDAAEDVSFDTSAVADLEELKGFDWESIEKYMDPGSYTLFDPLLYGERLFIGCQKTENYYILCFRKSPAGSYEWEQVLYPHFPPNAYHNYPELLTAYCDTEESELGLYIITDETMTGIEAYSGIWNYYRIDHWPALVLLDKADWGVNDNYNFDVCYGSPAKIAFTLGKKGETITFRETDVGSPDCQYLYYSDVLFDDGVHMPGSYALEERELTQLVTLLTQLPEDALVPCGEPATALSQVELYVGLDNGRLLDTRDTLLTFRYRDGSVVLGISDRYSKGESYFTSDSPFHYFQSSDPQLCDFLLSLCDDSRRESSLVVYNEPGFIEYSHAESSIQLNSLQGWEYEIVEYTDDATPFGIRARLKDSDGGWVFYSCWPGGFTIGDGYASVPFSSGYGDFLRWYPEEEMEVPIQDRVWAYDDLTGIPGNYVLVNEGADEATLKYCPWLDYEFGVAYTQCEDPSDGAATCTFGTQNYCGEFPIRYDWLYSTRDNADISYEHIFRFWPVGQTEGFISFAYYDEGFTPGDEMIVKEVYLSEPMRPFPAYTATADGGEHWQYLWIEAGGGCYVFRNDGADHWTYGQWLQVMEMIRDIVIDEYAAPQ